MKKIILSLLLLGIVIPVVYSQEKYHNQIHFVKKDVSRTLNSIGLTLNVDISDLDINSNHSIILTPILKANNGSDSLVMTPALINGHIKNKIYNRQRALNNFKMLSVLPQVVVERKNGTKQSFLYQSSAPLKKWMNDARIEVKEEVVGCADCGLLATNTSLIPSLFQATYELTYMVPEVEPVKGRSEKFTASFNYKVDKTELLHDFENNAAEFARVDKVITEFQKDKNLKVTNVAIDGYASPEGNFKHNIDLSRGRANAFANYLVSKYGLDRDKYKVNWHGEDWEGLRKSVENSSLGQKEEILRIIDKINNPDERDARLKRLSIYPTLLRDLYPHLRRNDYAVSYTVRPFDVKEAMEIIKTKPQQLSLNEMYLVAKSYPAGSKEFVQVFDVATRMFPNEAVAIVNASAADIEGNNTSAAIERLSKIEGNPKAWNNLGVAYAKQGDIKKAETYFIKATEKGDNNAKRNLEKLRKFMLINK